MVTRLGPGGLRSAALGLIFAVVAQPAVAQITTFEFDALRAQQEANQRRAVDQDNRFQALDARLRADHAAAATEPRLGAVRLWEPPYPSAVTVQAPDAAPVYPSMSDAALAESNRRVWEAAKNRR